MKQRETVSQALGGHAKNNEKYKVTLMLFVGMVKSKPSHPSILCFTTTVLSAMPVQLRSWTQLGPKALRLTYGCRHGRDGVGDCGTVCNIKIDRLVPSTITAP